MLKKISTALSLLIVATAVTSCSSTRPQNISTTPKQQVITKPAVVVEKEVPIVYEKLTPKRSVAHKPRRVQRQAYRTNSFNDKLSNAALGRLHSRVRYDGRYMKIAYPGGDVPANMGVCTDVVIRSYRRLGIDLQEQVHRDMSAAFNAYPNPRKWGLSRPDTNIDHRRVYNLRKFLQRRGAALPITHNPRSYKSGDLVTWMVGPDLPHIGVVVNRRSKADPNRLMIVHNIGHGPQLEDILFAFPITGHYRYTPAHMNNIPQGGVLVRRQPSKNRGMNYNQLVQAANLLGTNTNNVIQARTRPAQQVQRITATTPPRQANNQELLDQVVRLNSVGAPVVKSKDSSVKLAILSDAEIKELLK